MSDMNVSIVCIGKGAVWKEGYKVKGQGGVWNSHLWRRTITLSISVEEWEEIRRVGSMTTTTEGTDLSFFPSPYTDSSVLECMRYLLLYVHQPAIESIATSQYVWAWICACVAHHSCIYGPLRWRPAETAYRWVLITCQVEISCSFFVKTSPKSN